MFKIGDINIRAVTQLSKRDWDNFVESADEGMPFSKVDFLKIFDRKTCFIIAVNNRNKIIGGVAGRIRGDIPFFGVITKLLWIDSGIIVNTPHQNLAKNIKLALLEAMKKEAKRLDVVQIQYSHWSREASPNVFLKAGYNITPTATFIINLKAEEDQLFMNLDKDTRTTIRKARKNNVQVVHAVGSDAVEYIDDFAVVHRKTYERTFRGPIRSNMSLRSTEFMRSILTNKNIKSVLSLAFFENQLAAGALLLGCGSTLIYYIGGSDVNLLRRSGASNYLHWEIIRWAKEQGYHLYDMGGVSAASRKNDSAYGVYKFKKNFGGEYCEYYRGDLAIGPLRSRIIHAITKYKVFNRFREAF